MLAARQITTALRSARSAPRQLGRRSLAYYQGGENLQQWIAEMTSRPPVQTTDIIDPTRAAQLLRSLPTRASQQAQGSALQKDGPLPKAHHLIYFQTHEWLAELAKDGTSTEYNAPAPFSRRMWAGGSFEWNPNAQLRLGEEVEQSVSVGGVSVKSDKMMFVKQLREYRSVNGSEWAVKEERNHVFQPNEQVKSDNKPKPKLLASDMPEPEYTFAYTPSSPLLFRYSALTYNAHKIHYDLEWTRSVEGHPDLVVHGPMTATLLIELADQAGLDTATQLTRFDYRATSPMYVNREIKLQARWEPEQRGKSLTVWAEQDGKVGMKATATFSAP